MIYVPRRRTNLPAYLDSDMADAARKRAARYFNPPKGKRRKSGRFEFENLLEAVREPLSKQFMRKCAYCETRLKRDAVRVDRFRPPQYAMNADGRQSRDHYWWLAYEWTNLYPACADCLLAKASQFPLARGARRAEPGAVGESLLAEQALLLDPCVDRVEEHFHYKPDGRVVAAARVRSNKHGYERAEATIRVLELNRRALMRERAEVMELTRDECRQIASRRHRLVAGTGAAMSHPATRVSKLLTSWYHHLAPRKQVILEELEKLGDYGRQIVPFVPQLRSKEASEWWRKLNASRRRPRRIAYMTRLEIRNFKSIDHLALVFNPPVGTHKAEAGEGILQFPPPEVVTRAAAAAGDDESKTIARVPASWKVLIGENGVGKSSVLQAVALALSGEYEVAYALHLWDKYLRKPRGKRPRAKEGFVKIGLSTGDEIEMRFDAHGMRFISGGEGAGTYLRAFGATRNLPNTRPPAGWKRLEATVRTDSLFDPNSPMVNAGSWLAHKSGSRFAAAAEAIHRLLRLGRHERIRSVVRRIRGARSRREICIDFRSASVGLDELSDGYQSMMALAVEIMVGLPETSRDFASEPGIVLIDELGTHLHPRWRMMVVGSLKRAFPSMQFLATTHDPLCLRGVRKGEVTVLLREQDKVRVVAEDELPDPETMRIDQLLTSRYFGMESTIDPDTESMFERYYELRGKERNAREQSEYQLLKAQVDAQPRVLGFTRRDQLIYEVVDQYLAQDLLTSGAEAREQLRQETREEVARLFQEAADLNEAPQ